MSSLHHLKFALLAMTAAVNTNQDGHVFQLVPSVDASQTFKVFAKVAQSETGVTDTNNPISTTVHIEHSPDNENWLKVLDPITISNQDGTLQVFGDPPALMKFVRVRTVLTGATKPKHLVKAYVLSNRRFEYRDLTVSGKLTPAT